MKNISIVARFLSILLASCLLSLTVLIVSVVGATSPVNAFPDMHSIEHD
ncbi:hypothetical protein JNUCC31_06380 [Paenibacillus sp. JNUCC31]|nr:hypothetical protein [Paenibacillus sp. JNUCC-31]QOS80530.1 hypothetical protein JNUCC31_06380 [Paenibacillus sp. JNUCC-31]